MVVQMVVQMAVHTVVYLDVPLAVWLVVSMGGYNTLCELAAQNKRTLVIPRTTPRLEQTIRAQLWERRGAVSLLPRSELTPKVLADRVTGMLASGSPNAVSDLDLSGLDRLAGRFQKFWTQENRGALAVRL